MEPIQEYAALLNPADVLELFRLLERTLGSRSAAADACGLARKTAYDWASVKDLKFDTKVKLINTLMEKLPEETLDYLTQKMVTDTSDILVAYLSSMYESIMSETIPELIIRKLQVFDMKRNQYEGLITGKFDQEISDKIFYLKQKAKDFNLNWMHKPSSMMTTEQACILIPIIITEIISKDIINDKKISEELNVPEELVRSIRLVFQQIPTLAGFLPSNLRKKLEDVSTAITSMTNPPVLTIVQESPTLSPAITQKQFKGASVL